MGVAIPGGGFVEDRASGALVVDGGLRFTGSSYLKRTPGSTGNTTTYTISCWVKRSHLAPDGSGNTNSNSNPIFSAGTNAGSDTDDLQFYKDAGNNNAIRFVAYPGAFRFDLSTSMVFRDVSSWYHILANYDGTTAKIYINGTQVTAFASSTQNGGAGNINTTDQHVIGAACDGSTSVFRGYISQFYFIDGQALDASYFGYTDALTNTWRPKKLSSSVAFGTNGFYLPFDGSAPIGQDQSGRGNNWTPVNFGGSNTLEKATGALPILNTDGGGKIARVGVRTDSSASSLVLALPLVGIKSDFSNAVNSGTSNKTVTNSNVTFSSSYGNFYSGSAVFNGSNTSLTASSSDFAIGSNDFTAECWFYPTVASISHLIMVNTASDSNFFLDYNDSSTGDVRFCIRNDSGTNISNLISSGGIVPLNTWNHIAGTLSGTTARLFVNGILVSSGTLSGTRTHTGTNLYIGNNVDSRYLTGYIQDVRIYKGLAKYTQNFIPASTDPDILPDTPSGVSYTSNLTQITDGAVAFDGTGDWLSLPTSADFTCSSGTNFTFEAFIYPTSVSDTTPFGIGNNAGFAYRIISGSPYLYVAASGGILNTGTIVANKWTHIAITRNSGTLYSFIDGVLVGSVANSGSFDGTQQNFIGAANLTGAGSPGYTFTGHISNAHWVNGTALYTSNFTPPTAGISSVANTKLLCCKSNSSTTAFDVSPGTITANGNAAATNFNPFTVNINTQRGKQSGWATWNPLEPTVGTLSNGNLLMVGSSAWKSTKGTVSVSSGKWYYEGVVQGNTFGTATGNLGGGIGWYTTKNPSYNVDASTSSLYANLLGFHNTGQYNNFSTIQTSTGSMTAGDVIGVALNKDSNTFAFYKNGVSIVSGSLANTTDDLTPWTNAYYSSDSTWVCNFGQKPFKFPPPAGFQPLALANTPRPTIVRPDQYVGVSTYIGNGSTSTAGTLARTLTGLTFKPDLIWVKERTATGTWADHNLTDSVRGTGLALRSNTTDTETNIATAFSQGGIGNGVNNGFTIISGTGGGTNNVNANNSNYVAWAWKAGGNSNTFNINDVGYATASAAGLTAGTITPTGASVNTKSGFSIITWTRASTADSISHGLGVAPKFIICKSRSNNIGWMIGHDGLDSTSPWNYRIFFDTDARNSDGNTSWNGVPTSSVFYTGNTGYITGNMVAYCWAEIPGFSKFGSYTGNGSSDGPMVITGFRPRFLLFKSAGVGDWVIIDTTRDTYNVSGYNLYPNDPVAESFNARLDILSNGFKLRSTFTSTNPSGTSVVYAAFAETPTQNLYGAQANAR